MVWLQVIYLVRHAAPLPPPLLHTPLPLIPGGLLSVQDLNSFEEILLVSAGEEDHFSFLRELGIKRFISFQLGLFLCLIGAAEHFSTLNLVPHSRTKQCAVAGNLHMHCRTEENIVALGWRRRWTVHITSDVGFKNVPV